MHPSDSIAQHRERVSQPLRWVDSFKYLGSMFHETGSLEAELGRRVGLAAGCFRQLAKPILQQQRISLTARITVYVCMIISVLLYGSESWAITAAQLGHLEVFHNDCLRRILGNRRADRMPVDDILSRCRICPIRDMLHRRQLQWLGHLGRMPASRLAKQMLYGTMRASGRTRRRGRPPKTLCDTYSALTSRYFTRQILRSCGYLPGTSWHCISQNRAEFQRFLPPPHP